MSKPQWELPPEALAALERVSRLESRATTVRRSTEQDLERVRKAVAREQKDREKAEGVLDRKREALEALIRSRVEGFEFIAEAWADYETALAKADAAALRTKSHPAKSAAKEVRAKGKDLAVTRRELKRAQWVLKLYEFHFPWLTDLRDLEEEQSFVSEAEPSTSTDPGDGHTTDPAGQWLSAEEYRALAPVERHQRALDRYLKSRKSAWQAGRDYERYIGYLRESAGAKVSYQGIFAGLEDLGRDLIVTTDDGVEVIQCKRWAKHKTIHEKHVFQLFGTVTAARIDYADQMVSGTFTTTTSLSERARQFADQLDIRVEEQVPLADYPRVKCNINRTGERIYHLPFDQQYDATVIEVDKDEHWVSTCGEAEELGFRRAWRWRGPAGAA